MRRREPHSRLSRLDGDHKVGAPNFSAPRAVQLFIRRRSRSVGLRPDRDRGASSDVSYVTQG